MLRAGTTTSSIITLCLLTLSMSWLQAEFTSSASIQADGSIVFFDSSGGVADLVKQGTPRQSVNAGGQSLNVSYGSNSAGKKTILISLPKTSSSAATFILSGMNVSIPPGSSLRITLNSSSQPERMEGAPAGTVNISRGTTESDRQSTPTDSNPQRKSESLPVPPPPTQNTPIPSPVAQREPDNQEYQRDFRQALAD